MTLKEFFVSQLPDYILVNDSYKDIDGNGFVKRFIQILGQELDDYQLQKLESISNEYRPTTVTNPEYLNYFATLIGDVHRVLDDNTKFGKLLEFLISIFKIKGTIKSYKSLLTVLGHTSIDIVELPSDSVVYDDPAILYDDDPAPVYDDTCRPCSDYEVIITTSIALTGDEYKKVLDCIKLLEPINAHLKDIVWNGTPVTNTFILVTVDENGDLVYDNSADPSLTLSLVNGDLIISGPNASRYYLDNGDLYYVG